MQASELRRRAIAAVAKLSIFAGAAGCTGNVVLEPDTDSGTEVDFDTDDETDADTTPAQPDPEPVPAEPVPKELPNVPLGPLAGTCSGAGVTTDCCTTVLVDAFADPEYFNDPANATAQHKDCCTLVLETTNPWGDPELMPFDPELAWSCCSVVDDPWEDFQPTCAPWGPPMPPAMPRRPARRAPAVALEARPFAAEEVLA